MNVSPSPSPVAASAADRGQRAPDCRRDAPPQREQRDRRDDFERALRAKSQPFDTGDDASTARDAAPPDAVTPMTAWVLPPLVRKPDTQPVAAAAVSEPATGTRAAIETALQHAEPPAPPPLPGAERPAVWEASIGGLHGGVELRAERIVADGAPPSWGLTIGAPALGADLATRHGARLQDRLRKHGIDVEHVRIERKPARDEQPR